MPGCLVCSGTWQRCPPPSLSEARPGESSVKLGTDTTRTSHLSTHYHPREIAAARDVPARPAPPALRVTAWLDPNLPIDRIGAKRSPPSLAGRDLITTSPTQTTRPPAAPPARASCSRHAYRRIVIIPLPLPPPPHPPPPPTSANHPALPHPARPHRPATNHDAALRKGECSSHATNAGYMDATRPSMAVEGCSSVHPHTAAVTAATTPHHRTPPPPPSLLPRGVPLPLPPPWNQP